MLKKLAENNLSNVKLKYKILNMKSNNIVNRYNIEAYKSFKKYCSLYLFLKNEKQLSALL